MRFLKTLHTRGLAVFLALVMCLGMLPTGALAASNFNITFRIFCPETGEEAVVGYNNSVSRPDDGKIQVPYRIPYLSSLTDYDYGRVTEVRSNAYFGAKNEGVSCDLSRNNPNITFTYWVTKWEAPSTGGGPGGSGTGSDTTETITIGNGKYTFRFTIVYHSNYPSGPNYTVTKNYVAKSYVSTYNIFPKDLLMYDDCKFGGFTPKATTQTWYTDENCRTQQSNFDAAKITTKHLYAGWEESAEYKVIWYDENDNVIGKDTRSGTVGDIVRATEADKIFEGYTYNPSKSTDSAILARTGTELKLYFTRNLVTLTYHGNGNTSGTAPTQVPVAPSTDVIIQNQGTLERSGYEFLGWSTDANATAADWSAGDQMTLNADTTLYAVWRQTAASASYTVEWRDTQGKQLKASERRSGTVGQTVNVSERDKIINGYDYVAASSKESAVLAPAGTVLTLVFAPRDTGNITLAVTKGNSGFRETDAPNVSLVSYTVTVTNKNGVDVYGLDIIDTLTTESKVGNTAVDSTAISLENVALTLKEPGKEPVNLPIDGPTGNNYANNQKNEDLLWHALDRNRVFPKDAVVTLTYDIKVENRSYDDIIVNLQNNVLAGTWKNQAPQTAEPAFVGASPLSALFRMVAELIHYDGHYDGQGTASSGASNVNGSVPGLCPIEVTKTVDNETPAPGDTVAYTVTIRNLSTSKTQTLLFEDVMDAGLTMVGSMAITGGALLDDMIIIPAGRTATVTYQVQVSAD